MFKKIIIILISFLGIGVVTHAAYSSTAASVTITSPTTTLATSTYQSISSPPDFIITAQDISHAGFTSIEALQPQKGRFEEPVQYFHVGEDLPASPEDCADCSNLLAIYITPVYATSSPAWILDENPVIKKKGNRIVYQWFIGFRILYIIGPEKDKIEKLAKDLRERIVLNKTSH